MKNTLPNLTLWLLFILACNKPQITSPVPCADAKPFKADFYIQEQVGDSMVKTDKVMQYGHAVFEAADTYTSYKWTIGEDARTFADRKVNLLFTDTADNIQVRLIATKNPDPCFPGDKTIDTITRSFSVIPWRKCPLIGSYAGSFQSAASKKDTVKLVLLPQADGWHRITLININPGCNLDTTISWSTDRGAYAYSYRSDNAFYSGCKAPDAWLHLQGADTLVARFTYRDNSAGSNAALWPMVHDQFTGVRIK